MELSETVLVALQSDVDQWIVQEKEMLMEVGKKYGKNPIQLLHGMIRHLCAVEMKNSRPPTLQHLVWYVQRRMNLLLECQRGRLTNVPARRVAAA